MTETAVLPTELPLFPLPGAILLPGETLPLNVFEPRYLNMIDDVRRGAGMLGIVQPRPGGPREHPALAPVGGAGRLSGFQETGDGRYLITLKGVSRFAVANELEHDGPYRIARVDYTPYTADGEPRHELDDDRIRLTSLLQAWFQIENVEADWNGIASAPFAQLVDRLAMIGPFEPEERQHLLEAATVELRLIVMETIIAERLADSAGGSQQ